MTLSESAHRPRAAPAAPPAPSRRAATRPAMEAPPWTACGGDAGCPALHAPIRARSDPQS
jgi:hypothetical protein